MARALSRQLNLALIVLMMIGAVSAFYTMRGSGGVGGTGIMDGSGGVGGTGIFGRIDNFGSIWVNGHEIHYGAELPVAYRGGVADSEKFALGQIVAIIVDDRSGQWQANTASIIEEVIGPFEVSTPGDVVSVLEQTILFTDDTIFVSDPDETAASNSMVAISGFRTQDGAIIATRVERAGPEAGLYVRGPATNVGASGFSINDLDIIDDSTSVSEGDIVGVSGVIIDGKFTAIEIRKGGAFDGQTIEKISYQGVIDNSVQGATLRVGEYFYANASGGAAPRGEGRYSLVILGGQIQQGRSSIDIGDASVVLNPQTLRPAPVDFRRAVEERPDQNDTAEETEPREDIGNDTAQIDDALRENRPASGTEMQEDDPVEDQGGEAVRAEEQPKDSDDSEESEIDEQGPSEEQSETENSSDREEQLETDDADPVERPDRPERAERERPERPERIERPQRPDR